MSLIDVHGNQINFQPQERPRREAWSEKEIDEIWRHYGPYVQAAIDEGEFCSIGYVRGRVAEGTAALWPGVKSAIVTEIQKYDTEVVLYFWLAGGDLREIKAMVPEIERLCAQHYNCTKAVIKGRRGWERIFPEYAFKFSTFEKDLGS